MPDLVIGPRDFGLLTVLGREPAFVEIVGPALVRLAAHRELLDDVELVRTAYAEAGLLAGSWWFASA